MENQTPATDTTCTCGSPKAAVKQAALTIIAVIIGIWLAQKLFA